MNNLLCFIREFEKTYTHLFLTTINTTFSNPLFKNPPTLSWCCEMYFILLIVALTVSAIDLDVARIANAKTWIERSQSGLQTIMAYAPNVVNFSTIYHRVDYAGPFGPGELAKEYDILVNGLDLLIGYNPVALRPKWDPSTIEWITTDILRVDYTIGISTLFDPVTRVYGFVQEDFRFVEYIVYDTNSALINTGFTVQDTGANTLFELTGAAVDVQTICGGFIFPACSPINPATNQSYIADTGFTSVVDCITSLSQVAAIPQPCPYPFRADTLSCRSLHALSSFFIPSIHCAHTKRDSPVCRAQCLPACAQCHANASCVATYPGFPLTRASMVPVYECKCNNGFTGNGTHCTPVACSAQGLCPAAPGTTECSSGLCKCKSSFVHQPNAPLSNRDLCGCPETSTAHRINNELICVPRGRCIDDMNRQLCSIQRFNQVKCQAVNNTFSAFAACRCNYGFEGGWEYPCVCPAGKRIVWSNVVDGQVCLAPGECTSNHPDCASSQICNIAPGQTIGSCGGALKRRTVSL